jgi:hypothetical protein
MGHPQLKSTKWPQPPLKRSPEGTKLRPLKAMGPLKPPMARPLPAVMENLMGVPIMARP